MTTATTSTAIDLRSLALAYLAGGTSIVPCGADTKQPDCRLLPRDEQGKARWKPYQTTPPTAATVDEWFRKGCQSIAAVGGKVSGGLRIIDFDEARFYDAWREHVGTLADGLCVQRTGRDGGGYQVWFRCPEPGSNDKLAWVSDDAEETGRRIAIETRGEGGYAVMPGSLHPSGRRYQALAGDFAKIPAVPQAVADALLAAARKLDEAPWTRQQIEAQQRGAKTSNKHRAESNGQASVIDTYNERTAIEQELEARGYSRHGDRWKRPGGKSLSVYVSEGRSFHHSTNDALNDGYWHRPFDIFCALEHGGDCKAAVKAAAESLGLESQPRARKQRAHKSIKLQPAEDAPAVPSLLFPEGRTEVANALRLAKMHGDKLRWCDQWGKYLAWDGRRWALDQQRRCDALAKEVYQSLWQEMGAIVAAQSSDDDSDLKQILSYIRQMGSARGIEATLKLARSEAGISIVPDLLDSYPWLLNCENGTLDLRTGKLRSHRREDYLTKLSPVVYDPSALCPLWLDFQDRICAGNESLIDFKQRFYGVSLTGDVSEQMLAIYHGRGANGKSTEVETIMGMLGEDYAIKAASDLLMVKKSDTHPTERADLFGKRFVAVVETEHDRRLAESLVKELTGGDRIRARRMREDFWQFTPTHKLVIATNHKPVVRGTDHAIWRRIRLVPFTVTIPEAQQDKHLLEKLRAEYPGILAWCVRGCLAWQREGLGEPAVVEDATTQYRQSQDLLARFIDECCIVTTNARARAGDLLAAYRKWSGTDHASQRWLGEALTEQGYDSATIGGYVWRIGIGLVDPADNA